MFRRSSSVFRRVESTSSASRGGDAARIWGEATDADDLRRRLEALPGFGEMKVKALAAVLAKRFGVAAAEPLVPDHPTLGDVDSPEALEQYQTWKRGYKASLRAAGLRPAKRTRGS